jgi:hypothetical protein
LQKAQIKPKPTNQAISYKQKKNETEETPMLQAFYTYFSYTLLQVFGYLREFLRKLGLDKRKGAVDNNPKVD